MLQSTFLALLMFAGVAAADVQNGLVRSGGQPIPGATVTVECGPGTDKIPSVTDDAGRFEIGGLPSTSCKYTILIFGFEPLQKDAVASTTPLTFDLTMQTRGSIPVEPGAAPVVAKVQPPAAATAAGTPAPAVTAPSGPGVMPSLTGRGGQAGGGRGGQGRGGGYQSLSLTQNADTLGSDAPPSMLAGADSAGGSGASDAFTVNGTVSQGVQAQAGDGFGMGGPGGFGFGPGGPGGGGFGGPGGGGDFGGGGGRGGGQGGPGGGGRGGGGQGGPGGGGGAGFAGGGGPGGGGGFGGGPGGGGPGGGGGGRQGGGGRGGPNGVTSFGNRAGRGRGPQWQASVTYSFANSALNARPYSFQSNGGAPPVKASTANNQAGFTLGGPLMIPKTKFNLKNSRWNLNVTGARNRNGVDDISSVPTAAIRGGDFSSLLGTTTIYDPQSTINGNNTPFANNVIPASRLSPTALALLNFYPLPTSSGLTRNYQLIASNPNNTNNVNLQVSEPMTTKDRININFSRQGRSSDQVQNFGFRDPTTGSGENISIAYSKTLQPTLVNTFTVGANRNLTNNLSYFSDGANVAAELGINGVLATPATYGPPSLSFQNFQGLSDGTPSTNHSTTFNLADSLAKTKGKHNLTFGVTGTSRYTNSLTASNARGTFGFSGIDTEQLVGGVALNSLTNPTGYDLADFLLGAPASASVNQYLNGNNVFYYRQKSAAAYVSDDYRLTTNLTLSLGLRWEFYGPQTEKYNRMANLEFAPNGSAVDLVTPNATDPFTASFVPSGLIKPDYKMYEPQVGFAWKPWAKRAIVLRGGYGIRYNGGALQQQGSKLAIEPPFVQTVSLTSVTSPGLTLQNGLVASPLTTIGNTYAVAPNYKPAEAQQWNAIAQYTFARSYVFQMSYFGTKGSDLDVLLGPNRLPLGGKVLPYPTATSGIELDESIGNSIFHSGSAQLTRRFARGLSGSGVYTLQKSIDDSSTLGGGVVQIENNVLAERAVTASIPHQTFSINFNYQTLAGNQKSEFYWNIIRGWQLFGSYNLTSGQPFTATVAGDPSLTGIVGSARADATGLPVEDGTGYFNPAAFTTVPTGTYGTAGRNTIPGIWNFSMNASAMRSFRIGERHRLALTFSTSNPLNHPSLMGISTVIGSQTLVPGTPTSYGNMRTVSANMRFTF